MRLWSQTELRKTTVVSLIFVVTNFHRFSENQFEGICKFVANDNINTILY